MSQHRRGQLLDKKSPKNNNNNNKNQVKEGFLAVFGKTKYNHLRLRFKHLHQPLNYNITVNLMFDVMFIAITGKGFA